jgi:hypothetical protein
LAGDERLQSFNMMWKGNSNFPTWNVHNFWYRKGFEYKNQRLKFSFISIMNLFLWKLSAEHVIFKFQNVYSCKFIKEVKQFIH